jgi:hypothetical protein
MALNAHGESNLKCKTQNLSDHRVDLIIGSRKISLVGWDHPSAINGYLFGIRSTIQDATANGSEGNCQHAGEIIANAVDKFSDELRVSQTAQNFLKEIQSVTQIQLIGTEQGENEAIQYQLYVEATLMPLNDLDQQCNSNSSLLIATHKIRDLLRGPWGAFSRSLNPPIPVVGMENSELREQAAKINDEMHAASNDLDRSLFSPPIISRIIQMGNTKADGIDIASSQIDELVTEMAPNDESTSKKIRRFLKAFLEEKRLVHLRDQYIVDTLLHTTGNVALIIGWGHNQDVANQLKTRSGCN